MLDGLVLYKASKAITSRFVFMDEVFILFISSLRHLKVQKDTYQKETKSGNGWSDRA